MSTRPPDGEETLLCPRSVEVAVRRVGWLQAMLRDETSLAQPLAAIFGHFLGKDVLEEKGGLCEEQARLPWPSIGTFTCLKESRAQRSHVKRFGKMAFSRSLWPSLRRGRLF